MNQDRTAAVAELQELTQELEEMGNYFNRDGVIDVSEQAMLDEMKKEIDTLKMEMREMEEIHQNTQPEVAVVEESTVETVVQDGEMTAEGGNLTLDENTSVTVGIENGEVTGDLHYEKDGQVLDIHVGDDGVSAIGSQENEDGTVISAEISNERIRAGLAKEWKFSKNQNFPIPVFAGLKALVEFGIEGSISLEASSEVALETRLAKVGVKGIATAKGTLGLGVEAAEVVKLVASLSLIPTIEASGYLCHDIDEADTYLDLSGLQGKLDVEGSVDLAAADNLMKIYTECGGDEADLKYNIWNSGTHNLFKVQGPSYGKNGLGDSDWTFTEGEALIALKEKGEEIVKEIEHLVESIKAVVEFVAEVTGKIGKFVGDCIDDLGDYWDDLTMTDEQKNNLIQQGKFSSICKAAMEKLAKKKEHVKALSERSGFMDKWEYLVNVVVKEMYADSFIKQTLEALKNGDDDIMDDNDRIASTDIEIKSIEINGEKEADAFLTDQELMVTVDFKASNMNFNRLLESVSPELHVSIHCDGAEVVKSSSTITMDVNGIKVSSIGLMLPDRFNATESSSWEVIVKTDFKGELFDVTDTTKIKVLKKRILEDNSMVVNEIIREEEPAVVYSSLLQETKVYIELDKEFYQPLSSEITIPCKVIVDSPAPGVISNLILALKYNDSKVICTQVMSCANHGAGRTEFTISLVVPIYEKLRLDNCKLTAYGGKWTFDLEAIPLFGFRALSDSKVTIFK